MNKDMAKNPFSTDDILNKAIKDALGQNNAFSYPKRKLGLYDLLFKDVNSTVKGKMGEAAVKSEISNRIPGYYKVVSNILVPIGTVKTEIDMIMIHEKGIFVFEAKNYGGWIFGSEDQKQWTQSLPGGKKYHFYNPLLQNKTHCDAIANQLGVHVNSLFSYIVFMDRCEFKSVPGNTMQRPYSPS